jgi:hypothetical protein
MYHHEYIAVTELDQVIRLFQKLLVAQIWQPLSRLLRDNGFEQTLIQIVHTYLQL